MAGVEGLIRDGSAATRNNPVIVGGVDGSGNVQALAVDTSGNLDVVVATGPVTVADGADVAEGAVADTAVAAGAAGTVSAKLRRLTTDLAALLAQIPASLGIKTAANSLSVAPASDATFPVTTIVPGTAATNLGKAEDAAHTSGDTGVFMLGVRNDALSAFSTTDGDYTPFCVDSMGRVIVGSNTASGATDAGNPIKIGGRFNSTKPTLTDGQRGDIQVSNKGAQLASVYDGANDKIQTVAGPGDGTSTGNFGNSASTFALSALFNGSTYDRGRTPNVFKTATATASGDTAVWTPTSGKKFRLLRYAIYLTGNATLAAGANLEILLRDSTTATGVGMSVFVPTLAITDQFGFTSDWVWLDNGILSATANNVLNVNLSAALTAGEIRVVAIGTEE